MATTYQTLKEFINKPFGQAGDSTRDLELNANYEHLMKKIFVANVLEIDKSDYMIQIKIPSESNAGNFYDVVIHFFTDNKDLIKSRTFENYYIKFFSNSPSFIYRYAALYNRHGYLIESLANKFDKEFLNVMPEITNKDNAMYYDKSIYLACRYLLDNRLSNMNKYVILLKKTKDIEKFLEDVLDVEEVKLNNSVTSFKRSVDKEIKKNDDNIKKNKRVKENKPESSIKYITANHGMKKGPKTKKKAVKSTFKK